MAFSGTKEPVKFEMFWAIPCETVVGASGFEQPPLIKKLPSGVEVLVIDDWIRRLMVTNPDGRELRASSNL